MCILFADTNLGKSILSVQIGNSISKGQQIRGFQLEAPKQKVLYFDFELSAKQFEVRYSIKEPNGELSNHYLFDEDFIRIEKHSTQLVPTGIASYMSLDIYAEVKERGSTDHISERYYRTSPLLLSFYRLRYCKV